MSHFWRIYKPKLISESMPSIGKKKSHQEEHHTCIKESTILVEYDFGYILVPLGYGYYTIKKMCMICDLHTQYAFIRIPCTHTQYYRYVVGIDSTCCLKWSCLIVLYTCTKKLWATTQFYSRSKNHTILQFGILSLRILPILWFVCHCPVEFARGSMWVD